jgi:hypothetical protein
LENQEEKMKKKNVRFPLDVKPEMVRIVQAVFFFKKAGVPEK